MTWPQLISLSFVALWFLPLLVIRQWGFAAMAPSWASPGLVGPDPISFRLRVFGSFPVRILLYSPNPFGALLLFMYPFLLPGGFRLSPVRSVRRQPFTKENPSWSWDYDPSFVVLFVADIGLPRDLQKEFVLYGKRKNRFT